MTIPYSTPKGGTRQPTPKPGPQHVRITTVAWRQPVGGVRSAGPPPPGR